MSAYTNVAKPTGATYTGVFVVGKRQYDDSSITYDDSTVYYDDGDVGAYTNVSKPTGSSYTNIAKPTT